MKVVKIVITNSELTKTAVVEFKYEKWASKGTYRISGDKDMVAMFNFEAANDHMVYIPYSLEGSISETFEFATVCARIVAKRFGGSISFVGTAEYPKIEFDPNVIY